MIAIPRRVGVGVKARALWNICALVVAVLLIFGCMRVCSAYQVGAETRFAFLAGILVAYAGIVGVAVRGLAGNVR